MTRLFRFIASLIAILVTGFVLEAMLCTPLASAQVVPDGQWDDTAKLWLARSVVGEVGWRRASEQGEYSAVAYVYAVRAEQSKTRSFLDMVKKYSAAVRAPGKRRNPWLFELGFDGVRPKSWPIDPDTRRGPRWEGVHKNAWLDTLRWADDWQAGLRENPCPGANHFGGWVDRHRAQAARWTRVKCAIKTGNRFYNSLRLQRE